MSAEGSPIEERFEDEDANQPGGLDGIVGSDDEEDAIQDGSRRRKTAAESLGGEEGDEDDLFGDGDGDDAAETAQPTHRQLDDEELDSGDDEGRRDRLADEPEGEVFEERDFLAIDMEITRQPVPEPSDGEMYLLKVPAFMTIEPQAWQTTTFQPPTTDHHSRTDPSSTFSAFNTALTTIRWRHSPSEPSQLQSNARINRWSDGSLTVQLASNPNTQYEIDGNPLAPPQRNPHKPTPTSISTLGSKGSRQGAMADEKYDPKADAFTYLIVPVEGADALRVSQKLTAGLTIRSNESGDDDAIEKLQAALAAAANAIKVGGANGNMEVTDIDPEAQRREAEAAERQTIKARKKNEAAKERESTRDFRALERGGLASRGQRGGLNIGMLEDDEMEGGRRRGGQPGKARGPRRRQNSEYSEDEDMGRKRFTREDSYDQEDDFLAPSDEEEEVEDDDDPDDGIVEEARQRTPKRDRPRATSPAGGEDEDAEGEIDDDVPQARTKRRRVVDDDDEEE